MMLLKRLLCITGLALLAISSAHAKAPVWKISKAGNTVYLGGTIHMLSKKDYPLPDAFQVAYKNSDDLVFEADIQAAEAPELQAKMLEAISFQDHRGLSSVLDRDVYSQLDTLLKSKGLPIAVFDSFTPAGAMMAITQFELERLGVIALGVDSHFTAKATADKKDTLFLETVDEQLAFIESMNQLEPNAVVKSGIKELESLESMWAQLLTAWREGDLTQLEELGIESMKSEFPSLFQTLLVKRNNAWLTDIDVYIKSEDVEFVLVGALHMAGKEGLVAQLVEQGYKVEQLD